VGTAEGRDDGCVRMAEDGDTCSVDITMHTMMRDGDGSRLRRETMVVKNEE